MRVDTCAERIRKGLSIRSMKAVELCSKTGIPKSAMSQYINNKFEPKQDRVYLIAKALDVSEAWLMGYDVPMERAENTSDTQPRAAFEMEACGLYKVQTKKFRMLGNIACGEPIFADEEYETLVEASSDIDADFCLRAHGDSMIGARINDGDIVFIHQQDMVENGEIAAVLIDDEATLKRVQYDKEANVLMLFAENPQYKTLFFTGEELDKIKILGKAVAFQSFVK